MEKLHRIHPQDNVLIVKSPIVKGERIMLGDQEVIVNIDLSFGHKVAAAAIAKGERITKFGIPIGSATQDISTGEHVHLHNLVSDYIATYTMHDEYISK